MEDRMSLLMKISVGFFFGIIFGFIIAPILRDSYVLIHYVMPFIDLVGKIFLSLLTMLIVPLVFSSIVSGVASVEDARKIRRWGLKTIFLYLFTTLLAIAVGLVTANIIKPGTKIDMPHLDTAISNPVTASEFVLDMFPTNPIASMMNEHMLQIIVFGVFLGIACSFTGKIGQKVSNFFEDFASVMYSMTHMVMSFAPYGVFALISTTAARYGLIILTPFAKVIAAVYIGCAAQAFIVYSGMVMLLCRRSPFWFFRGIQETAITGFVTRSSAATLPINLADVRKNLGVSMEVSAFVLPLGATINMDGTAIYQTVCALFIARAFNIPVTLAMQLKVFVLVTLASVGTAGIPGAGLVMLTMVLTGMGLPLEGIALVAGIDVILNAARTCINVVGDAAVCAVVATSEGETLAA